MSAIPGYGQFLTELASRFRSASGQDAAEEVDPLAACAELLGQSGEVKSLQRARALLDRFEAMGDEELFETMRCITETFGPDRKRLEAALTALDRDDPAAVRTLHAASEARTQDLLRKLNQAPSGTRSLVGLRARVLRSRRKDRVLRALDSDFHHLFSSWFNRGFLELRRIDWSTSAAILERIIRYEAVHEIIDWSDLKRRVSSEDRRLYAFFHPALPDDPLIFVEIALTKSVPSAISTILDPDREVTLPADATTAVFYSISNCQPGLKCISFGNFLIKQVVEDISREMPGIESFVTLSPVPGFRRWVETRDADDDAGDLLSKLGELVRTLRSAGEDDDALRDPRIAPLAACYLAEAKRRDGQPDDPVARFHLGNGARLEAIHIDADPSSRGRASSWGAMVNYRYHRQSIERNQEAYATKGEVTLGPQVRQLLRSGGGRNVR